MSAKSDPPPHGKYFLPRGEETISTLILNGLAGSKALICTK